MASPTLLAPDRAAFALTGFDRAVYFAWRWDDWDGSIGGAIRRAPVAGGPSVEVVSAVVDQIAVSRAGIAWNTPQDRRPGTSIFFVGARGANGREIGRLPRLLPSRHGLALTDTHAFWVTWEGGLFRAALDDPDPVAIAHFANAQLTCLAVTDDAVVVAVRRCDRSPLEADPRWLDTRVVSLSRDGGAPREIARHGSDHFIGQIVCSRTHAYWVAFKGATGRASSVHRAPLKGGESDRLESGWLEGTIAIDDHHVYFARQKQSWGRHTRVVERCALDGGRATPIVPIDHARFVVTGEAVVWATADGVMCTRIG
jgi:hypothetical protein